jgi:hypothetical protein
MARRVLPSYDPPMRHLPLLLSLFAASSLAVGCGSGGNGNSSSDDDDDDGTGFPNPGAIDVPTSTGPQATLPDLTVDLDLLLTSQQIRQMNPANHQDEVAEGCLVGDQGIRNVLVFSVGVANIGPVDLIIGDPWSYPDENGDDIPDQFEWSPAHGHLHFPGFADYRITNASGEVATGRKQAFCLMDIDDYAPDGSDPGGGYDCEYQGISAGWEDVYDRDLPCQWVDVTDIPDGDYELSVTVNAQHKLAESGPGPNTVTIPLTLPLP